MRKHQNIVNRCSWVNYKNPLYIQYHDTEWGIPQHADKRLFEMLMLECFQANSRVFIQIQKEFGSFDRYIWGFTDEKVIFERCDIRTSSPLSDQISRDLKKRGMKFVGSTIIYAYLQAIGILNAHESACDCYEEGH